MGAHGRQPLVALLAAGLLAVGIGACGGSSSQNAGALVKETFAAGGRLNSGRVDAAFALTSPRARGAAAQRAFVLRLNGPFQGAGAGQLPRFALAVRLRSREPAVQSLRASVTSAGSGVFVGLDGQRFVAPRSIVHALQRAFAVAGSASPSTGGSRLSSLGLDPGAWLVQPRIAGSQRIAGSDTIHLVAAVDAGRFLADLRRISGLASSIGSGLGSQSVPPALAAASAETARVARAEVYTGAHDHLLRRLSVRIVVGESPEAAARTGGPGRVTIRLLLNLTALNQPQAIVAPSSPQPASKLGPQLKRLGLPVGRLGG
jgi:hypothetical protein